MRSPNHWREKRERVCVGGGGRGGGGGGSGGGVGGEGFSSNR